MELMINGTKRQIDSAPDTPLLWVIREELGLTGTKYGCGAAQCGACTVLADGRPLRSCIMPVSAVLNQAITTIEVIEEDPVGKRVVDAWVKLQVPQCGYCQSGQVLTATALLKQNAKPSEAEVASSMLNLCRCGTYNAIADAMQQLAKG
ncbi:(2Fe-2S)-binding protein [Pseudomonas sp. EA_105y_Pfl2_R69]|jgi:isoquinoline 1-oxidoreductase alpha subunit|uniref:(2Fe-2S)-binding protein n=1 Tax=Pseudomonas sp. EA_105y_Pfl2_R69 TaxID=3088683 RepID=UPI0030D87A63